jgi:hypothetical protein
VKKCHSNIDVSEGVYAPANQSNVQFWRLLESEGRRAYQRVSGGKQYASASISFVEKGLQSIGVNFRSPYHHGIDLARR